LRRRLLTSLVFAAALVGTLAAGPAQAQPPSNDSFANATVVSTPPFSDTLDTTEATSDSDDAEVLAGCGVPVPAAATVWYAYTPSADQIVTVDASSSTYQVGVGVVTGAPGSFSVVSCFEATGSFPAVAGQTYYIDLADIGGGNGGTLATTITALLRPDLDFSVNRFGSVDPDTGVATVAGRATCTPETTGQAFTSLFQQTGHGATTSAFRFTELTCDGTEHPWSVPLVPASGKFKSGPANFAAEASACNLLDCRQLHFEQTIVLRRKL
jgi:hypothetical protein